MEITQANLDKRKHWHSVTELQFVVFIFDHRLVGFLCARMYFKEKCLQFIDSLTEMQFLVFIFDHRLVCSLWY